MTSICKLFCFLFLVSSVAAQCGGYSWSQISNISVTHPAFLAVLPWPVDPALIITSFGGSSGVFVVEKIGAQVRSGQPIVPVKIAGSESLLWPNGIFAVPSGIFPNAAAAFIVGDGFLVPGKGNGNVYAFLLRKDGKTITKLALGTVKSGFFIHTVQFLDMNKDGLLDILYARGKKSMLGSSDGDLVWLQQPSSSSSRESTWVEHVIASGPDVNFIAVGGSSQNLINIYAAQFFSNKLTLTQYDVSTSNVTFQRTIDDSIGAAYQVQVVDINGDGKESLLVQNHAGKQDATGIWAYDIPSSGDLSTATFTKHTIISGFFPISEGGFNQASPGYITLFNPSSKSASKRPFLAVAGDGAQTGYVFCPNSQSYGYDHVAVLKTSGVVGQIAVADVDGDGNAELFIPNYDGSMLSVFTTN